MSNSMLRAEMAEMTLSQSSRTSITLSDFIHVSPISNLSIHKLPKLIGIEPFRS